MQVKINGVQIGYDDFGQGPVVLFLHDYLLDRQMWKHQVEPLVAAGFRVILTDLRGCGESDPIDKPVLVKTHSADIIGLLNYLGIGRVAVCGLSVGNSVLYDLKENYPQRVVGTYLAISSTVQSLRSKALVSALKANRHRQDSPETSKLLASEACNPITHQAQVDQSLNIDQTKKQDGRVQADMENVQEFNRHLLDFLTNLAPRKNDAEMTPLSSVA